nr:hypothetical protein [Parvularcula dongshanensis]
MALAEAKRHAARARAVQAEEHENAGRRQAALYGAMPPAKAAAVLSSLDADAAARILEAMPPQTAGAIVAAMTADSAKAVARAMSG